MSKIIRYCKLNEEHSGDNVFDVSRPNIFGNPFTHIKNKSTLAQIVVKTREKAVELYDKYFDKMMTDESEVGDKFREEFDRMYNACLENDIVYIGCYCKEDETCHGDIIRKKLMQRILKDKLKKLKEDDGKTE